MAQSFACHSPKRAALAVTLAAIMALAGCGGADEPDETPDPLDATFDIEGSLVLASGECGTVSSPPCGPLLDATATLQGTSINAEILTRNVTTDAQGYYRFVGVPVGVYTFTPSKAGYDFLIGGYAPVVVRDHGLVLPPIAAFPSP
jgi:Carboxypeptidase regulatory-like domain